MRWRIQPPSHNPCKSLLETCNDTLDSIALQFRVSAIQWAFTSAVSPIKAYDSRVPRQWTALAEMCGGALLFLKHVGVTNHGLQLQEQTRKSLWINASLQTAALLRYAAPLSVAGVKEYARLTPTIVPVQCTNSRFRSSLVAKFATYQLEPQSARSLLLWAGMAELE